MTSAHFRAIADALAEELRRMPCRYADYSQCPRCIALERYERAVAEAAIVQTVEVAREVAREAVGKGEAR